MNILTLADVESKFLWDYYTPGKFDGVDLVLACGDLSANYLSFIATFTPAPVLYVHGNHDKRYLTYPPEGCICIEDTVYTIGNLRVLGLGGSMRYKPGPFQYTEKEMQKRIARLRPQLRRSKGFDILLTHSPALGLNDDTDLPHRGFACFNDLLAEYQPLAMVHGHVHLNYGANRPRHSQQGGTQIINAYEKYTFQLEAPAADKPLPLVQRLLGGNRVAHTRKPL